MRKVQIGAGYNLLPGWLNCDVQSESSQVVYLDATKPFPFPDKSIDCIFSEHMIEHIDYDSALSMLSECRRVMRPGGTLRIATPNVLRLVSLFKSDLLDAERAYITWGLRVNVHSAMGSPACLLLNNLMRGHGHEFLYDPETLISMMHHVGLHTALLCAVGESQHDHLRGIESHGKRIGKEQNVFESMVVEATA